MLSSGTLLKFLLCEPLIHRGKNYPALYKNFLLLPNHKKNYEYSARPKHKSSLNILSPLAKMTFPGHSGQIPTLLAHHLLPPKGEVEGC